MPCTVLLLTTTDQQKTAVPGFTGKHTEKFIQNNTQAFFQCAKKVLFILGKKTNKVQEPR